MSLLSSRGNESPDSGRKFVPGLGWVDLNGGLDKYVKDPFAETLQSSPEASPEFGWDEVHRGLGQILVGQVIWVVCALLGALLCSILSTEPGPRPFHVPTDFKSDFRLYWLVITGLIAAVGYRYLLAGKWRCLLNAPERNGLRWIMFACITGIATAPIFHTTAFLTSGLPNGDRQAHDVVYMKKANLNTTQAALHLAGTGAVLLSSAALLLFLRTAGKCFSAGVLVFLVDLTLFALLPLAAVTLAIFFDERLVAKSPSLLIGLEFSWLGWVALYFILNLCIRHCIMTTPNQVEPPSEVVASSWQVR
jgi:hypothetical protein